MMGAPPTEEDKREIAQRQEHIRRLVDPVIVRRSLRWEEHGMLPGRRSTAPPPPLPMAIRPQPTHFDRLADWYCGYLGVRDEYEQEYEMQQDLKQNVPQAILRDIYRPVSEPYFEWEQHELQVDPGGRRALAEAKQAQKRPPLPTVPSGLAVVVAAQRRRQRFLDAPWATKYADSAPRKYATLEEVRQIEAPSARDGDGDGDGDGNSEADGNGPESRRARDDDDAYE